MTLQNPHLFVKLCRNRICNVAKYKDGWESVAACHKYRKNEEEAGLCGSMGEPQIWGALMSLFGAQLCVCL